MQWKEAATQSDQDVLSALRSMKGGLTLREAAHRFETDGPNELAEDEVVWWRLLLNQFRMPFVYLLLVAAVLSFVLGEWTEAALVLFFLCLNVALGFFQEYRSVRTVALLKEYFDPTATALRDGSESSVSAKSLVRGDVVVLRPGDIIPADIRIFESEGLTVDESVLTGESAGVEKSAERIGQKLVSDMYRATNIGFSGTTLLSGKGLGVVIAVGAETAIGEIATFARASVRPGTFEKEIGHFGSFLVRLVVGVLFLVFFANLLIKGHEANVTELLIFSLVLVVSVLPEALPFFITTALSRGSLRLAKKHVVVKRLASIEELGSIEVLCTDKTGTLTEGRVVVASVSAADEEMCLQAMFLAGGRKNIDTQEKQRVRVDPFDGALWNAISESARRELRLISMVSNVPFDPIRRRASAVIQHASHREMLVRGAPETILDLCVDVPAVQKSALLEKVRQEGIRGNRALAVARKGMIHARTSSETDEHTLVFVGLVFFADPVKPTAEKALHDARKLGVAVKMITGDGPEVAGSVARTVGLERKSSAVMTGSDWDATAPKDRLSAVERCSVFARISPKQKYEIIETLQQKYTVGFLGDGINDAPALRLAHVALAVQGASGVARESADVVLLEPSLSVIVDGIREGRVIFANISKYLKAMLASNFGNFYSVALVSLFIPFVPMLPVQILLIDILSDIPMLARAADSAGAEELKKPKNYDVRGIVFVATVLGLVSSVFDFILFALFAHSGTEGVLRTNWFVLSLFTEVVLLFSIRTNQWFFRAPRPSWFLLGLSVTVLIVTVLLPYTAFGQTFFHFVPLTGSMLATLSVLLVAYFGATELTKVLYYRMRQEQAVR